MKYNRTIMEETGQTSGMHCTKCGEFRLLSVFRVRRGKHEQPCKKCYLEYGRRHYQNNKQYYIDKADKRNAIVLEHVRRVVWEYLREHPCVDCGNNDPRVMEFDHVRGVKKYNVSEMQNQRHTVKALMEEIAKCDVRCANCHRIKTYHQFGWHQPKMLK